MPLTIDGNIYFFDETGKMLTDTTKDGYRIAKNGIATEIVIVEEPEKEEQPAKQQNNSSSNSQASSNGGSQSTSQGGGSSNSGYTPPSTPSYSANGSSIAAAALSQIGVTQDCTSLVSNSLAAAGIYYHGWPEGYLSLGTLTSSPVPGDIIVYIGHVAIYIGNGQAVHGGWDGYTTKVSSVSCANALIGYVHIG